MTPATAAGASCPLHLETQVALHTLALKTHEGEIAEIKAAHHGLAEKLDEKFDRLYYWMFGILAAAAGGLVVQVVVLLQRK